MLGEGSENDKPLLSRPSADGSLSQIDDDEFPSSRRRASSRSRLVFLLHILPLSICFCVGLLVGHLLPLNGTVESIETHGKTVFS